MLRLMAKLLGGVSLAALAFPLQAALTPFDLLGKAGSGLLSGNETGVIMGMAGSGGELGSGIFYDDVTNLLVIQIGWGSGFSFTDLTGTATVGHVHGPTPSVPPASFNEAVPPLIGLDDKAGWNPSASNGSFIGSVIVPEANEADLFAGRLYINIHTMTNPGGEIRGNLIPVPEPGTYAMLLAGLGALTIVARRRMKR